MKLWDNDVDRGRWLAALGSKTVNWCEWTSAHGRNCHLAYCVEYDCWRIEAWVDDEEYDPLWEEDHEITPHEAACIVLATAVPLIWTHTTSQIFIIDPGSGWDFLLILGILERVIAEKEKP